MSKEEKRYTNEILEDVECYKAIVEGKVKKFPTGFWTKPWSKESAAGILKYLFEERLHYTEEDIKKVAMSKFLIEHKLRSMSKLFDDITFSLINNAYPGKFKPWELNNVPAGFWDVKENVKDAVRWLVEVKLDNDRERVCKEFTREFVSKNAAPELVQVGVYHLINMVYPNEYKPWELSEVSSDFWENTDNIRGTIKWLVKTKLDNNKVRVRREFNKQFLINNGFSALTKIPTYNLIEIAFPNQFKPSDFATSNK